MGRNLFGNRIEAYHLLSLAVFAANALLLFSISLELLPRGWAFLPPLLLASRLSHVQVLLYTSEFQGLSSALLSLAALRLFMAGRARLRRSFEALAVGAFVLALLSKESSVALPVIVTAYGWLFDRRGSWPRFLLWWATAAGWALLFAFVLRGVSGYQPTGFAYDVSLAVVPRYAAYFLAFFDVLVYPVDNRDMVSRVAALAGTGGVLAAFVALAAVQGAVVTLSRRLGERQEARALRVMAFGFAWFLAATAPFVIFADRLFMRYGYFGHAGLALMAASGLALVSPRLRRPHRDA